MFSVEVKFTDGTHTQGLFDLELGLIVVELLIRDHRVDTIEVAHPHPAQRTEQAR